MPIFTIDSLAPDIDAAEVAAAVAAHWGGKSAPSPKHALMLMARKVAGDAERVAVAEEGSIEEADALANQEMAVVAHLAALLGHALGDANACYAADTSAILVEALAITERQDVCGYTRSDAFATQIDTMIAVAAAKRRQRQFGTVVLVAGKPERDLPDYESYMKICAEMDVAVVEIEPEDGAGSAAVAAAIIRRFSGSGAREYL